MDISKTNDKFGTAQDLKDLSSALHARGMYLMVDVVRTLTFLDLAATPAQTNRF